MLNKIFLFMLISIILGFIISYYYNRNFKGPFVLYFIISSLILFILFYFLGGCKNDVENFANKNIKKIVQEVIKKETQEEEHHHHQEEEHHYKHHIQTEENDIPSEEHYYTKHNKHNKHHIQTEEHDIPSEEHYYTKHKKHDKHLTSGNYAHIDEESNKIGPIPDNLLNPLSNPPLSTSTNGNNPININISYNSQNSVNELDNNESRSMKIPETNNNSLRNSGKKYINRNLGPINPPNDDSVGSRINTDGDWIYGKQAWTNNPDYYSPEEYIKQTYKRGWNEMTEANKYRKNTDVCPLMANVPWTEYKSGDSEPEPYNVK
jgi:hypothetical protein